MSHTYSPMSAFMFHGIQLIVHSRLNCPIRGKYVNAFIQQKKAQESLNILRTNTKSEHICSQMYHLFLSSTHSLYQKHIMLCSFMNLLIFLSHFWWCRAAIISWRWKIFKNKLHWFYRRGKIYWRTTRSQLLKICVNNTFKKRKKKIKTVKLTQLLYNSQTLL